MKSTIETATTTNPEAAATQSQAKGRDITVILNDGSKETVRVQELPLRSFQTLAETQDNSESSVALFCGKEASWGSKITRDSAIEVLAVGDDLNGAAFARWVGLREKQARRINFATGRNLLPELQKAAQ